MKKAFTLIELLVVVAIIAILAGILLPAIASAKHKANQAASIGNLRQLGTAINLYLDDSNNTYPSYCDDSASNSYWFNKLNPYVGSGKIWNDPSNSKYQFNRDRLSYGYNMYMGWYSTLGGNHTNPTTQVVKQQLVANSSGLILIAESDETYQYYNSLLQQKPLYQIGIRYNQGADILWCDNHVSWSLRSLVSSNAWSPALYLMWGASGYYAKN